MDPMIEEFNRVRQPEDIRFAKLREWQRYLREVIQPQLDELAALKAPALAKRSA